LRILVLSFYYTPDLCAGSFRVTPLVAALRDRAPPGTQIDVVTTVPNRYSTFTREAPELESEPGLEIRRIRLPSHSSDMLGQSRAFVHFARHAWRHVADRKYDLVFATSSRLMTAALAAWVAKRLSAPLYLDIRDLFVDTIKEVLPAPLGWPAKHVFSVLESWTLRRAARVNLVSRGFETYVRRRFGDIPLAWFTNGIDDEFLHAAPVNAVARADGKVTVLYAGNLGEGQAMHTILPQLARELRDRARFVVIGDGGRRRVLQKSIAGLDNVELGPPMHRSELLKAYQSADVLFLHLGDYDAFRKVLPSKVFEYAAVGKPVLAGVAGYAARFITEEIRNAAVFAPGDASGAVRAFESLQLTLTPRTEFVARYARANIAREMADDILRVAGVVAR
jgi:glycosyltransferase involved in cell wall biosynthesis